MHDAYASPPDYLRAVYKKYQRMKIEDISRDQSVVDFLSSSSEQIHRHFAVVGHLSKERLESIYFKFDAYDHSTGSGSVNSDLIGIRDAIVYESITIPGLRVIPALLPPLVQISLLSRLFHRDLSNPSHKTNLHMHYNVKYSHGCILSQGSECVPCGNIGNADAPCLVKNASFFMSSPEMKHTFEPKDHQAHKSLSLLQALNRKLRWMTLGGQYDWTRKIYPEQTPCPFPQDIAQLLHDIFPDVEAQAAIVNVYSPGDTLSLHRDVSEHCDQALISASFGCDGLFVIGTGFAPEAGANTTQATLNCAVLRLRSGDVVYMSQEARFAWHGVPRILANTCPTWLESWPADPTSLAAATSIEEERRLLAWRKWMSTKRINLNVRQMNAIE